MDGALLDKTGPQSPESLGDQFIALGRALNNPNSRLEDVVRLAYDCGLILVFKVAPETAVDMDVEAVPHG